MTEEYLTVQHPPFFVSDQRAIEVLCFELKIKNIYDLCVVYNNESSERRTIAAYILNLYTGMSISQISVLIGANSHHVHAMIHALKKKVEANRHRHVSRKLSSIINKL